MCRDVTSMRRVKLGLCALVLASLSRPCGDAWGEVAGLRLPPHQAALAPAPARPLTGVAMPPLGSPNTEGPGATMPAPEPPRAVGEVDVCGYGSVRRHDDDALGLHSLPEQTRRAALAAGYQPLLSSQDEATRAAGLLVAGRVDSLAWLAVGSTNSVAYAIALHGCTVKGAAEASACALLSPAQWARLDPDNAWPWLELAAHAREQGDAPTEEQAMWQAAHAGRMDDVAGKLSNLVDQGLGQSIPRLQRTLVLAMSWQLQSGWQSPVARQAEHYCAGGALLVDGPRRLLCDRLAQTLVTHGDRVEDFALGATLGARLAWPGTRLLALRQEADALADAAQFQTMVTDVSCDSIERIQGWLHAVGTGGEVQAARAVLAHSGRSVAWWSAQHQKNTELAAAVAAEAAVGAERLVRDEANSEGLVAQGPAL